MTVRDAYLDRSPETPPSVHRYGFGGLLLAMGISSVTWFFSCQKAAAPSFNSSKVWNLLAVRSVGMGCSLPVFDAFCFCLADQNNFAGAQLNFNTAERLRALRRV